MLSIREHHTLASDIPLPNLKVSRCMQSIFEQQRVDHIVQTPLFPSMIEVRLIWKKNDGNYSV